MTRPRQTATHIPVAQLVNHPDNIRQGLGDLTDLASSIREHGILQPITVTEQLGGGFLILAGHRRFGAGLMVGLDHFPAIVRHDVQDPAEHTIVMLVENVQRRDLSPIEKAQAFGSLRNRGLGVAEIARRTGVKASTISTLLNLLELDGESQEKVQAGELNAGDAIAAVRQVRAQERQTSGAPRAGRPLVVEAEHFGAQHRLLPLVSSICSHTTRPKVGLSGCCGQCWEAAIRSDATGQPMPGPAYDEMVVQRILGSDPNVHATPADRVEVVNRWRASGRALEDLGRRTGWRLVRYTLPETAAAS